MRASSKVILFVSIVLCCQLGTINSFSTIKKLFKALSDEDGIKLSDGVKLAKHVKNNFDAMVRYYASPITAKPQYLIN